MACADNMANALIIAYCYNSKTVLWDYIAVIIDMNMPYINR